MSAAQDRQFIEDLGNATLLGPIPTDTVMRLYRIACRLQAQRDKLEAHANYWAGSTLGRMRELKNMGSAVQLLLGIEPASREIDLPMFLNQRTDSAEVPACPHCYMANPDGELCPRCGR